MDSPDRFLKLIYGSYLDRDCWRMFCQELSDKFGRAYIAMHGHDCVNHNTLGFLNTTYSDYHLQRYKEHFSEVNPWAIAAVNLPVGVVHQSEAIVPFDNLIKTEWYNDWIRPQEDIATGAGVTLFKDETRFFRLSCNIRLPDQAKYQSELVDTLKVLVPHICHSLAISQRLAGIPVGKDVEAALNLQKAPLFLLDSTGRCVFHNFAAGRLLARTSAIGFTRNGILRSNDDVKSRQIGEAVEKTLYFNSLMHTRITEIKVNGPTESLLVSIAPFGNADHSDEEFLQVVLRGTPVAIAIVESDSAADLHGTLARKHGLTRTEIDVVLAIMDGKSIENFAIEKGKSINTVRAQLKSVFAKLDVGRQAELVGYISKLSRHLESRFSEGVA